MFIMESGSVLYALPTIWHKIGLNLLPPAAKAYLIGSYKYDGLSGIGSFLILKFISFLINEISSEKFVISDYQALIHQIH